MEDQIFRAWRSLNIDHETFGIFVESLQVACVVILKVLHRSVILTVGLGAIPRVFRNSLDSLLATEFPHKQFLDLRTDNYPLQLKMRDAQGRQEVVNRW